MDLIKLKHQKNEINVIEKLTHLLTIFVEVPRKLQIMTQMASYYIFVQPDLTKSCELMKECIKMNYDENILVSTFILVNYGNRKVCIKVKI